MNLASAFQWNLPLPSRTLGAGTAPGTYYWIFAAVRPGSLADNRFDPGDLLTVGAATFTFTP